MEFTDRGIRIGGSVREIYSGSVQYWRLSPELWSPILDNIKELGFHMIETYIPWQVHETEPGRFDFGNSRKNTDVVRFLDICREKELYCIVRPGPHINAEMTYFGYPRRIVLDPDIQARTSFGTPCIMPYAIKQFPIPGYASEKLYEEVALFFDALASILKSRLHPHGPIVAIQNDNETCYFFLTNPYMLDYSPDSVSLYRSFLSGKYEHIDSLNERYNCRYNGFNEIEPPAAFRGCVKEELPYYFDWAEYKEYQIKYAVARIGEMWKNRGIDILDIHNLPADSYFYATPFDIAALEKEKAVSIAGIDSYCHRENAKYVKDAVRFLNGTSKMPFIPEFGSGAWYSNTNTYSPEEEEFLYLYAYMYGLKAANFYMLVERDRWQGAPITRNNRIRSEYYSVFRNVRAFLTRSGILSMERERSLVILRNYDMQRLVKLSTDLNIPPSPLVDLPPELFRVYPDFNFRYIKRDYSTQEDDWIVSIVKIITENGIDFDYSNSHIASEHLNRYHVAVLPTFDFTGGAGEVLFIRKKALRNLMRSNLSPVVWKNIIESGEMYRDSAGITEHVIHDYYAAINHF